MSRAVFILCLIAVYGFTPSSAMAYVKAGGKFKPCIVKPDIQRPLVEKPDVERPAIIKPLFEKQDIEVRDRYKPEMAKPMFDRVEIIEPKFEQCIERRTLKIPPPLYRGFLIHEQRTRAGKKPVIGPKAEVEPVESSETKGRALFFVQPKVEEVPTACCGNEPVTVAR